MAVEMKKLILIVTIILNTSSHAKVNDSIYHALNNNLIDNTPLTYTEVEFFKRECSTKYDFEYNIYNCIRILQKLEILYNLNK